jgi:hypothetical protein
VKKSGQEKANLQLTIRHNRQIGQLSAHFSQFANDHNDGAIYEKGSGRKNETGSQFNVKQCRKYQAHTGKREEEHQFRAPIGQADKYRQRYRGQHNCSHRF